jgi:ABC-type polar amino acid transport system ATPase subunit
MDNGKIALQEKRKMHWVKWADLAKPKSSGGMGFKDFILFQKSYVRETRVAIYF